MNDTLKTNPDRLAEEERVTAAIWMRGLDLLAEKVRKRALPPGELDECEAAELLDKLLVGTGECQCGLELGKYMGEYHGWDAKRQDLLGAIYSIVDAVRTSDTTPDLFWSSRIVDVLAKETKVKPGGNVVRHHGEERQQIQSPAAPTRPGSRAAEAGSKPWAGLPGCWQRTLDIVADVLVSAEEPPTEPTPPAHEPLAMQVAAAELFAKVIARLGPLETPNRIFFYLTEERNVGSDYAQAALDTYFLVTASTLDCFWNDATLEFISRGGCHLVDQPRKENA